MLRWSRSTDGSFTLTDAASASLTPTERAALSAAAAAGLFVWSGVVPLVLWPTAVLIAWFRSRWRRAEVLQIALLPLGWSIVGSSPLLLILAMLAQGECIGDGPCPPAPLAPIVFVVGLVVGALVLVVLATRRLARVARSRPQLDPGQEPA